MLNKTLPMEIHLYPANAPLKFAPDDWVAVDIEIFHMNEDRLHRADTGEFACISLCHNGYDVYICQDQSWLQTVINSLSECNIIGQNFDFDIKNIRRWANFPDPQKWFDTMYAEKIMYGGYYERFSEKDLARRYLGLFMEKETRNMFAEADVMNDEMIQYAALDVVADWHIAKKQLKIMRPAEHHCWENIDRPCIFAIMQKMGFKLDFDKWMTIAKENKLQAETEKAAFPFNPNAPGQVKNWLNENEDANLKSTEAGILEKYIAKSGSVMADRVIKYRQIAKLASTYGENWKQYVEPDGRIYAELKVNGAETGRMSSSHANLQNVPIREHPIFRTCFVAGEGNVLVIGDYSSQEPRCLAYLSKDPELLKIFINDLDIYCEFGKVIYGRTITKADPERNLMKKFVLAISYGMSAKTLAENLEVTEEIAQGWIDQFFAYYCVAKAWMDKQRSRNDYVLDVLKRRIWLNRYSMQCERNALNDPIQGSASEITKLAVALLYKHWPIELCPFGFVMAIHDEIVIEVPKEYERQAKKFLTKIMIKAEEAILPGIPAKVDVSTGMNWGCKK